MIGPPSTEEGTYPPFNGKKERSIRDIKSYERAMRRHTTGTTLCELLGEAIHDLNEQRPRPVLCGRTAREVFEADLTVLPDRGSLQKGGGRGREELAWDGLLSKRAGSRSTQGRRSGIPTLRTVQRIGGRVTRIGRENRDRLIGRYRYRF